MATIKAPKDSKALAMFCSKIAVEKKATELLILNIHDIDGAPCEWFVIASCASEPQLRSAAEAIVSQTKKVGVDAPKSEGWDSMNWIILDYFDVVVHLMKEDARAYYKLEKLWSDAAFFTASAGGRMMKYDPLKKAKRTDGED